MLVVVFHFQPTWLPGGYVGVDVFFVISGFLITGLLVRRTERADRLDFKDFYIRRARRLLPAACLVLAVTGFAALAILPRTQWAGLAREIVASAIYLENFELYRQGQDYLEADRAPSPLQHYWSLSIEEQFYIVWPLTIAFGVWMARRLTTGLRPVLFGLLALITAASLWRSATVSPVDAGAYFLTSARLWELAIGGLLAIAAPAVRVPSGVAIVLRWAGLGAILFAAFRFSGDTVFPGKAALIPTLGALVLLLPRTQTVLDPATLLEFRPMQWLGDISYSLYLWHWPVIVLGAAALGGEWALWQQGVAFAAMLGLSHWSKHAVEDRFRHAGNDATRTRRAVGLAVGSLVAPAIAAAALVAPGLGEADTSVGPMEADLYPGAAVLVAQAQGASLSVSPDVPTIPSLDTALRDMPELYRLGCQVGFGDADPKPCEFGDLSSDRVIAVVGDSHAAQYLPAIEIYAEARGLRVVTHTKSSCAFVDGTVMRRQRPYTDCAQWNDAVRAALMDLQPELVITAKIAQGFMIDEGEGGTNDSRMANAAARHYRALGEAGIRVMAISRTPVFPDSVPDCIAAPGGTPEGCAQPRAAVLGRTDQLGVAADRVPTATRVDINDLICGPDVCDTVIGNVLVYRDPHHLTATYVRTMAPYLGQRIDEVLGETAVGG